jgi:hypothetical protein
MKRRTPPKGRPDLDVRIVARAHDVIARLEWAMEALELKAPGEAHAVLRDLVAELRFAETMTAAPANSTCPTCSISFRWPGELDHHLRVVHDRREAA